MVKKMMEVHGMPVFFGDRIRSARKAAGLTQRQLAGNLQILGLDVDKNAVQRIESGQRFVTDIELIYLSKALKKSIDQLLGINP